MVTDVFVDHKVYDAFQNAIEKGFEERANQSV